MIVFRDEHSLNNNIFTSTHYADGFIVFNGGVKLSIGEHFSQFFDKWKIENGKWKNVYGQGKFVTLSVAKSLLNSDQELSDQVIKNFSSPDGEVRWGATRRARTWR